MMEGLLLRPLSLRRSLLLPVLARHLSLTSVASSERPNIRRPQHPTWQRQKLLAVSTPVHTEPHPDTKNLWRDCPRAKEVAEREARKVANEFEMLYAKELKEYMDSSKTVAVFHTNRIKHHPARKAWQNARRVGMELKSYNHRIARAVFAGTKWECLMHFWDTNVYVYDQFLAFGKEVNAKDLLSLDRKIPEMVLLGAIVEDRFLNKAQLQDLAKMPSIDVLRGELCSILQASAQKTVSLLESNQQSLSRNLDQFVKDQTKYNPLQHKSTTF